MKSIREAIYGIISERILPWIEQDGISNLILPEQITPDDCAEPTEGRRLCEIRHYDYLLGFGLTGKTPYCINNRIFVLKPGMTVLLPRWTPHGAIRANLRRTETLDLDQSSLSLWLLPFMSGVYVQVLRDIGNADMTEASHPYMLLGQQFDRLTTCLLEEVRSDLPNHARVARYILLEFVERCLQSIDVTLVTTVAETPESPSRRPPRSSRAKSSGAKPRGLPRGRSASLTTGRSAKVGSEWLRRRIQDAQEFIHSNYHRPIGLDDISHVTHTSASHFIRQFKAATGLTPIQYLLKVRMDVAGKLLLTNLKICEVARMVGIEDARYFSRLFRQSSGVSPLQYRRKMIKATQ